jgi:hypothetical protein
MKPLVLTSSFVPYDASTEVHFRSSLLILTCSGYVPVALLQRSLPTALDRSSLEWFEACSWKPTPKGLPSSPVQLMHDRSAHL